MAIEKILNKRSNDVITDGGIETPKKPTSSQLDNGEIAVNYHKGTERLFIKNDNDEIVEFISKDEVEANYYDKDNTDTLLANKQNTINDIATIRSGAAAGATAVQPNDLATVATSGSYNDLSDKPTLDDLNKDSELYALDNSNRDYITAVTLITQGTEIPISHDIEGAKLRVYKKTYGGTETGNKTTTIIDSPVSELPYSDGTTFVAYQRGNYRYIGLKWNFFDNTSESYTNGNIEVTCEVAGVLKLYFFDCGMKEDAYFKKNGQTTNVKLKDGVLSFDVEAGDVLTVSPTYYGYQWVGLVGMSITSKYPVSKFANDAEYVTEDFVNSSIATATATYRGSYNLVSDLLLSVSATQQQIADALATKMEALSITPDNNDYCFVQIPTADATPTEIARIDRYKYDGTAWAYEYSLNNSSFTAEQWSAINSGITSGLVAKLSALPTNSELTTALAGKQATLTAGNNINISNNVISANNEGWEHAADQFAVSGTTAYGQKKVSANSTLDIKDVKKGTFRLYNSVAYNGDMTIRHFKVEAIYTGSTVTLYDVEVGYYETKELSFTANIDGDCTIRVTNGLLRNVVAFYSENAYKEYTKTLATVGTTGSYNDLSDKPDLSAFITNSVDDLMNYYLKSETYTKTEVDNKIGNIETLLATI